MHDAAIWSSAACVYYWRTNLAVVLGVATAVAVLAGALLVGDSVRGSLRDLVLAAARPHRPRRSCPPGSFARRSPTRSAADRGVRAFAGAAPADRRRRALVSEQASGRRASRVQVYGVDDRFWRFHGVAGVRGPDGPRGARSAPRSRPRSAPPTASAVLVRVERPSAIPLESLHGRKDDAGRTLRLDRRARSSAGASSASSRCGRSRATSAPCSCRSHACSRTSSSPAASTRCSCRTERDGAGDATATLETLDAAARRARGLSG